MPESNEQQAGASQEVGEVKKPRSKSTTGANAVAAIRQKYGTDRAVNLKAGENQRPMGEGPVVDPSVITRLASVDPTPNKQYLDWMLFQAGGGVAAVKNTIDKWGIGQPDVSPQEVIDKYHQQTDDSLTAKDVRDIAELLKVNGLVTITREVVEAVSVADLAEKYRNLLVLIEQNQVTMPGGVPPDKIAGIILSHKMRKFVRKSKDSTGSRFSIKVKDRIHALAVWNSLLRGKTMEEAEEKWLLEASRWKVSYIEGDEDAKSTQRFGLYRKWPGGPQRMYGIVLDAITKFLSAKSAVDRYNENLIKLGASTGFNRVPIPFSADIGRVTKTKDGYYEYSGNYKTIDAVLSAVKIEEQLPVISALHNDVRYADSLGGEGHDKTVYSDENIDVLVPLTLAAAVKAGHKSWQVTSPDQMAGAADRIKGKSDSSLLPWTKYNTGLDAYAKPGEQGLEDFRNIPVIIHIKGDKHTRALLTAPIDSLVTIGDRITQTRVKGENGKETTLGEWIKRWKPGVPLAKYQAVGRSLKKMLRFMMKWGKEFDPSRVVADPSSYYKQSFTQDREQLENLEIRASQVVELLTS